MQKHLYPIFSTSHVNGLCSTHVYLPSILEYSHAWSKYHMFSFPCHMFVSFFHMPLLIIPHAISKSSTCSLPFITHYVSSLQYISIKYLSCIFSVLNLKSSSPLLSHFTSEVYSFHPKSRAHKWQVAQHIRWGLALICLRYCTQTLYFPIEISTPHLFCPKRIRDFCNLTSQPVRLGDEIILWVWNSPIFGHRSFKKPWNLMKSSLFEPFKLYGCCKCRGNINDYPCPKDKFIYLETI